jgi:hypothetical protein
MLSVAAECDRASVNGRPTWRLTRAKGENMWWALGIGGIVYLILVFTLGWSTLWNGHGWMFVFGIFFPVLWLFGAFMRPPEAAVRGG